MGQGPQENHSIATGAPRRDPGAPVVIWGRIAHERALGENTAAGAPGKALEPVIGRLPSVARCCSPRRGAPSLPALADCPAALARSEGRLTTVQAAISPCGERAALGLPRMETPAQRWCAMATSAG